MRIYELDTYVFEQFFDFEDQNLFEANEQWTVRQSTNFKKGWKKHKNDKRVSESIKDILTQLKNGVHPMDLPQTYNVHPIKSKGNPWHGFYDAHVKGQKIILLFNWDKDEKRIDLAHLGTHQEAKLTKD